MHHPDSCVREPVSSFSIPDPVEVNLCSLDSTLNSELDFTNQFGGFQKPSVDRPLSVANGALRKDILNGSYHCGRSTSSYSDGTKASTCSAQTFSLDRHHISESDQQYSPFNLILDSLPWIVGLIWMLQLWINSHEGTGR